MVTEIQQSLHPEEVFRRNAHPLSVETYHTLGQLGLIPKNSELLLGTVVEKMSKFPLHSKTAGKLHRWLDRHAPPDVTVRREDPITSGDSEPEPDISVVAGSLDDYEGHPSTALLAVEVAVTSFEFDAAKAAIYAVAGIGEYWIVRPAESVVIVYRQPEGRAYKLVTTHPFSQSIACSVAGFPQIQLAEIFAAVR